MPERIVDDKAVSLGFLGVLELKRSSNVCPIIRSESLRILFRVFVVLIIFHVNIFQQTGGPPGHHQQLAWRCPYAVADTDDVMLYPYVSDSLDPSAAENTILNSSRRSSSSSSSSSSSPR